MVDIPTLMIWGEEDSDVAIDKMYRRYSRSGMDKLVPDLTIKRFPDASHWVQQDAPERGECGAAGVA